MKKRALYYLKSTEGFVLLEVAIALIIIGVITTMMSGFAATVFRKTQIRTTIEKQEMIIAATAAYIIRHNHLPCPSNDSLNGESLQICDINSSVGLVPYKTLGLPYSASIDGFGKKFLFIVNYRLTSTTSLKNDLNNQLVEEAPTFCGAEFKTLQVNDSQDQIIAVAIYSAGGNSSEETPYTISEELITLKQNNSSIIKWVTRDVLMSHYAKTPCTTNN